MSGRERLARMRQAAVEGRAALGKLRDLLAATERELAGERAQLADAERRGRLAAAIDDHETVGVAARFAAKHGERVQVLERKLEAQRAELVLAEREVEEMVAEVKRLELGLGDAARDAAGAEPRRDEDDLVLRQQLDRAAREAAAEEALRELKKRMGK